VLAVLVNSKDGNLISFKVLINSEGNIVTEMSGIPINDLDKIFKDDELSLIKTIILLTQLKLEPIHEYLSEELSALNHKGN